MNKTKTKPSHEIFSAQKQKSLLIEMIRTDFKLRYQESILGYTWSILKPLFLFGILYTVFSRVLELGKDTPNYALSLLLAIVLWSFFAEATSRSLKSIVSRGGLIRKIYIPRHLIPLSVVASASINLFLNLIIVLGFVLFSDHAISPKTFVIFPLLLVELFILATAVGVFMSAIYVRLRDIDYIWEVVRQALFYAMPIIYPLSKISNELLVKLYFFNPLTQIIQDARHVITYEGTLTIEQAWGTSWFRLVPVATCLIILVLSWKYFNKHSKYFAENI